MIVLFLMALIAFMTPVHASELYERNNVPTISSTLEAIQGASRAGADTSDLALRFNTAIDFLEQAETSEFHTCNSSIECTNSANNMLQSIFEEARVLRNISISSSNAGLALSIVSSLILAFIIAYTGILCYNKWKSLELKRFLDMEIRAE